MRVRKIALLMLAAMAFMSLTVASASTQCDGDEADEDPEICVTSPAAESVVSGIVTIEAEASDFIAAGSPQTPADDVVWLVACDWDEELDALLKELIFDCDAVGGGSGLITEVEFIIDGEVAGSDSTAPYSFNWDTSSVAPGSRHTINVAAVTDAGNRIVSEALHNLYVEGISMVSLPSTVPALSSVSVEAADADGVASVSLLVDGNVVSTDTEAPFSPALDTSGLANGGTYSISAKLVDGLGNEVTSAAQSVTVDNVAPSVAFTTDEEDVLVSAPEPAGSTIEGTASDSDSGLTAVALDFRGDTGGEYVGHATINGDGTWSMAVPFALNPGTYTVKATALDGAGNTSTDVLTVLIV